MSGCIKLTWKDGQTSSTGYLFPGDVREVEMGTFRATVWRAHAGTINQIRFRGDLESVAGHVPSARAQDDERTPRKAASAVLSHATLDTMESVRRFAFAGKAKLTLVSHTGARVTFSVNRGKPRTNQPKESAPYFVRVEDQNALTVSDTYLGAFWPDSNAFRPGRHTDPGAAVALKAVTWFFTWVTDAARTEIPTTCQIWHAGLCGKCGLELTDPLSIHSGFGATCAGNLGIKRQFPVKLGLVRTTAGYQVLRDKMMDLGADDPSAKEVVKWALRNQARDSETGELARIALDALADLGLDPRKV